METKFKLDILEDDIKNIHPDLLKILLKDKSTQKNILWCTKDYEDLGPEYDEHAQIKASLITRKYSTVIQPRAAKSKEIQERRMKKRAEVFTPSWICNEQNNGIDTIWFGKKEVFNKENGITWKTNKKRISFEKTSKTWMDYIEAKRMEITCGEAPYLISRYDTTTGNLIPVNERIGLFDRKMRIVNENCETKDLWIEYSLKAVQSIYGFEYQGDSVLIARENFFFDYLDYYLERFKEEPSIELMKEVANIISWNIWQMDGKKFVIPFSCHDEVKILSENNLFESNKMPQICKCPGCEENNFKLHNGIYCKIKDWTKSKKSIPFFKIYEEELCL